MQHRLRVLADVICSSPDAFELGRQWATQANEGILIYLAEHTKDEVLFTSLHQSNSIKLRVAALQNRQITKSLRLTAAKHSVLASTAKERGMALRVLLPDHMDAIPDQLTQSEAKEVGSFLPRIHSSLSEAESANTIAILKLVLPYVKAQTQDTQRNMRSALKHFSSNPALTHDFIVLLGSTKNVEQAKMLSSVASYLLQSHLGPKGEKLLGEVFAILIKWSSDASLNMLVRSSWGSWVSSWLQGNLRLTKELLNPLWQAVNQQTRAHYRSTDIIQVMDVLNYGTVYDLQSLDYHTAAAILRAEICVYGANLTRLLSVTKTSWSDYHKVEVLLGSIVLLPDPNEFVSQLPPELVSTLLRRVPKGFLTAPTTQNTPVPVDLYYPSAEQKQVLSQLLAQLPPDTKTMSELTSLVPSFTGTWQDLITILLSNQ